MGRKGGARFPAAKVKKIIQENQDIGKLCNTIPPILQRSLEIFLDEIVDNLVKMCEQHEVNKLTLPLLKEVVQQSRYDFMKATFEEVEDFSNKKKAKRSNVHNDDNQKQGDEQKDEENND